MDYVPVEDDTLSDKIRLAYPTNKEILEVVKKKYFDSEIDDNGDVLIYDRRTKYKMKDIVNYLVKNIKFPGIRVAKNQNFASAIRIALPGSGAQIAVGRFQNGKPDEGVVQTLYTIMLVEDNSNEY